MTIYIYCQEGRRHVVMSRKKHSNTDMLVMDTQRPPYTSLMAVPAWPEETIEIEGQTYRKGVWRSKPFDRLEKMMYGFQYNGKWYSVRKDDQFGLETIRRKVLEGMDIPFVFVNGEVLVVTQANIEEIDHLFTAARASFFPMPEEG